MPDRSFLPAPLLVEVASWATKLVHRRWSHCSVTSEFKTYGEDGDELIFNVRCNGGSLTVAHTFHVFSAGPTSRSTHPDVVASYLVTLTHQLAKSLDRQKDTVS
jgi:hypothetical protein